MRAKAGGGMNKKKYLMTAGDLFEYGLAITNQLGLSAIETLEFIDKFLDEHEYRERTCHVIPDGSVGRCSACGDDVFADPNHKGGYCPSCGAEVIND